MARPLDHLEQERGRIRGPIGRESGLYLRPGERPGPPSVQALNFKLEPTASPCLQRQPVAGRGAPHACNAAAPTSDEPCASAGASRQSGLLVSYSAACHPTDRAFDHTRVAHNPSVPVCRRGAADGTRRLRGFLASAGIGSKKSLDAAGPAHRPDRTRNGAAEVSTARPHEHIMRWTTGYPS